MIKNSSEYLDVMELVDFVLKYGRNNTAYQAALRLQKHGLPKAYDLDLGLIVAVVDQIKQDSSDGDFTAIEELFQYLDDPRGRLKGYLPEGGEND